MRNVILIFSAYFSVFTSAGRLLLSVAIVRQSRKKNLGPFSKVANTGYQFKSSSPVRGGVDRKLVAELFKLKRNFCLKHERNSRHFYWANEICAWYNKTILILYNIVKEKWKRWCLIKWRNERRCRLDKTWCSFIKRNSLSSKLSHDQNFCFEAKRFTLTTLSLLILQKIPHGKFPFFRV